MMLMHADMGSLEGPGKSDVSSVRHAVDLALDEQADTITAMLGRSTICVPGPVPGIAAHTGDHGFNETLQQHYSALENNAAEQLIDLKRRLQHANLVDFWRLLMEGMTNITGSQYGFVSKREIVDENTHTVVELPPLGEPGSCLLAVAFYYNDGESIHDFVRDYKYHAFGTPCEHMKHDKVFLVPNGLPQFVPANPNPLPFSAEAYIGIPLFAHGKSFGHFGIMWSEPGARRLRLSWAYIEILLHALEDLVADRLLNGQDYIQNVPVELLPQISSEGQHANPPSLRPYARTLSHELRTPMQGVVGMLDVMHATVEESLGEQHDPGLRKVFASLRDNIEVVQDSSRRAVEAADNVVHAYDLNMEVPGTPVRIDESGQGLPAASIATLNYEDESGMALTDPASESPHRRKRLRRDNYLKAKSALHKKQHKVESSPPGQSTDQPESAPLFREKTVPGEDPSMSASDTDSEFDQDAGQVVMRPSRSTDSSRCGNGDVMTHGLRNVDVRELLHNVIHQSLHVGCRSDSTPVERDPNAETIVMKTPNARGDFDAKTIRWTTDPDIPRLIRLDEQDFTKLISCVFQNAVKFTEHGTITVQARLRAAESETVVISIADTGQGIPKTFLPFLFKPFSREDDSLTRHKEGLGLGLLVAKGLARKIGGDLMCIRSETGGPNRGSEFELHIPFKPAVHHPINRIRMRSVSDTSNHKPATEEIDLDSPISFGPLLITSDPRIEPHTRKSSIGQDQLLLKPPPPLLPPPTQAEIMFDRQLASKYPLTFLVAEDNILNRRLLVSMLAKLGYKTTYEACDGQDAVEQMKIDRNARGEKAVDIILMDLWMPNMDGYEATRRILSMQRARNEQDTCSQNGYIPAKEVTIVAVTADITNDALEMVGKAGMAGYLTKPYKVLDLQRKILEYCIGGGSIEIL